MYKYAKDFNKDCIPHINERNDIVDKIHNYPRPPKAKRLATETEDNYNY